MKNKLIVILLFISVNCYSQHYLGMNLDLTEISQEEISIGLDYTIQFQEGVLLTLATSLGETSRAILVAGVNLASGSKKRNKDFNILIGGSAVYNSIPNSMDELLDTKVYPVFGLSFQYTFNRFFVKMQGVGQVNPRELSELVGEIYGVTVGTRLGENHPCFIKKKELRKNRMY